ncbi:MAG: GAF domain-containing protein [Woeseia sp.]
MTDSDTSIAGNSADQRQRFRELEALHRASTYLHRLRDPAALARDVITLLKDVVHHDFAAVYLIDGDSLKTFAVSDRGLGQGVLESDLAYLDSLALKVGENITGWVAQSGESLRIDDVSTDERYLDSQTNIASELCVPMWSGDTVIGVVNIESTRKHAYRESDQRVLEIVANQIAVAIENGKLLARNAEVERLQALADITGGIAHDIGNLLVAMSFRCDLMKIRGNLPDAQKEELLAIRTVLDKTLSLSRSLLQIGLPQQDEATVVDLNDHLRNTQLLMEALGSSRMKVMFEICDGEARVAASPGQIDQVLINLAVNARQAINDSGHLIIRTRLIFERKGDKNVPASVALEVQDDGCGMSSDTLAAAMQPLFTTREDGSGLGLATVARLVEELNGSITIQSDQRTGTLVQITLPIEVQENPVREIVSRPVRVEKAETPV